MFRLVTNPSPGCTGFTRGCNAQQYSYNTRNITEDRDIKFVTFNLLKPTGYVMHQQV